MTDNPLNEKIITRALLNLLRRCEDIDLVTLPDEIFKVALKAGQPMEKSYIIETLIDKIDFIHGEL